MDKFGELMGGLGESFEEEIEVLDIENITSRYDFSFCDDHDKEEFLKKQSARLHTTITKGHTKIGEILKETQDDLAGNNHYDGYFEKWYKAQNYNKSGVYRYINRYNFIQSFQNETTKNFIETLPITLSYEVSNPNCKKELIDAVLQGKIKTLKEFNEFKLLEHSSNDSNTMKDVTPITFETIDSNIKTYLHSMQKFDKDFIAKKDLSEEKLIAVNQKLEKAKKLLSDAWELIE